MTIEKMKELIENQLLLCKKYMIEAQVEFKTAKTNEEREEANRNYNYWLGSYDTVLKFVPNDEVS